MNDERTRPLTGKIYCSSCGYANPSTQTFCTSCGKRIKSSNVFWKIAVVALVLIAGLSWAAYLFSNSVSTPNQTNTARPQSLISTNTNTTHPETIPQPAPSPSLEIKPPPKPSVATPTPTPRPTVAPTPEPSPEDRSKGDPNIKVWVNTASGVYHCPGTRWYGATINGEYMTQKKAQEGGNRPAYGNYCQ
jgi:hypothetical protein